MLIVSEKWITTKCQPPDLLCLGWPTAPPLHRSALITLQPLLERRSTQSVSEVTLYANPFGKMDYDEMSAA